MANETMKTFVIPFVLWLSVCVAGTGIALAAGPSFDCGKVQPGSIEELICRDKGSSLLDSRLAEVYAAAAEKSEKEHPPAPKAEQRGWIKGRNECWKAACDANSLATRWLQIKAHPQAYERRRVAFTSRCWFHGAILPVKR